jgi:alkylated DNA repair dioxygenase AlkB
MSYHSDNEKELGTNPIIASLSFGEKRKFLLKHRFEKSLAPLQFELSSQSLLVMKGELQHFWVHKIAKSTKIKDPRLNLTFRFIHN